MTNKHLARTRKHPSDEYYTSYSDIEAEVLHYTGFFKNKIAYCNCDDEGSLFTRFFVENFQELGLKKLVTTGIGGCYFEFDGNSTYTTNINGDFRSDECHAVLDCADVVVTNPPFSLFNEFFSTVTEHGKDFLVIGPKSAVSYSSVFPLFHEARCSIGYTSPDRFTTSSGNVANLQGMCRWFTSLPTPGKEYFTPTQSINDKNYEHFDLYPALNVNRTADIPCDYDGLMGVPLTAAEKLNPINFEMIDLIARYAIIDHCYDTPGHQLTEVNGRPRFSRLIIKHKL